MDSEAFRGSEPFSAVSHALAFIFAVWGAWRLCRMARIVRTRITLGIFGVSMMFCYAASALFHAVPRDERLFRTLLFLDHACVFALIAGTITPIAVCVLRGFWRIYGLVWAWGFAALGIVLQPVLNDAPSWMASAIYLTMGWGVLVMMIPTVRAASAGAAGRVIGGGAIYSIGAVCDMLRWPVIWPGVIGHHEVFHVFVMAGSYCHYRFMIKVIISREDLSEPEPESFPGKRSMSIAESSEFA